MNFNPPKIYAITDAHISGISHLEQVERLIAGGIRLVQLREKHASPRDFFESAKPVVDLARRHNVTVIINDRVDIAMALNAHGVHLGQEDLSPADARRILGPDAIIGFSAHSADQAHAAMSFPVDYIAIGPIFITSSKENPDAVVGIETLNAAKSEMLGEMPLVAIGGINSSNLRDVLRSGADSVALIAGLVSDPSAITATAEMLISLTDG